MNTRQFNQDYQRRLRLAVIEFLGGVCVVCGYSDPRALQVDHIKGGGGVDRKKRSWVKRYKDILSGGDTSCQLLCANCNWIKRHEKSEWSKSCNDYTPRGFIVEISTTNSFDLWRKKKKLTRQGITQIIIKK